MDQPVSQETTVQFHDADGTSDNISTQGTSKGSTQASGKEKGQESGQGSSSLTRSKKSTKITCLANFKRHSLQVEHLQEQNRLRISFKLDLLTNCVMQVFFMHTEDTRNGARLYLVEGQQEPSKVIGLSKGLNQTFPSSKISADDLKTFEVQLDKFDEQDLVSQQGKTYPLVIRLVAIKPSQRQNSLSNFSPSGPLPLWVQAQTTYAVFGKSDDKWTAEVILQKLWIEGIVYELQEIYGIDHAGAMKSNELEVEGQECVVCLTSPRDTTVLPCRHLCMCSECARELQKRSKVCPICREKVKSLLHIKLSGNKHKSTADKKDEQ